MYIQKTIEQLVENFAALKEYFGETIDCPVYSECAWMLTEGGDVRFSYEPTAEEWDDLEYSCEIVGQMIYEKDEYTAVYGDNGCGDQFWMIFDNEYKVEFEEE